ncbi:M56 family peptidase, partial [Streptomyces sp. SID7909]|nr:M56 family peptidase [Streptomyces sp. SID7909]
RGGVRRVGVAALAASVVAAAVAALAVAFGLHEYVEFAARRLICGEVS